MLHNKTVQRYEKILNYKTFFIKNAQKHYKLSKKAPQKRSFLIKIAYFLRIPHSWAFSGMVLRHGCSAYLLRIK